MHRAVIPFLLALAASSARADLPLAPQYEPGAEHHYLQQPGGAAAVELTSRPAGRLIVAFPAGNSGVGLWLTEAAPADWKLEAPPHLEVDAPSHRHAAAGAIRTAQPRLTFRPPLGGTVRLLREYDRAPIVDARALLPATGVRPADVPGFLVPRVDATPRSLTYAWTALAGGVSNRLELSVDEGGSIARAADGRISVSPGPHGRVRFRADTAYAPLTPWPADRLYDVSALARLAHLERADPARGRVLREGLGRLRFLFYEEKLLAGSWRYLTYFGRDTLLTMRMLRPLLTPEVVEAALASVITRLSPEGRVAHEEDLGDQAALDRTASGSHGDAAVYDYKMVDGDFLLAIALSEYAADPRVGPARARAFLAQDGRAARVRANVQRVLAQAAPFAADPRATNLVSLLPGSDVGDWRDSQDGLARGRYAFSLNAVLVPQALAAIARLRADGVLEVAETPDADALNTLRMVWSTTRSYFDVRQTSKYKEEETARYLREGPLEPAERAAFSREFGRAEIAAFDCPAVSLDKDGRPIPVMCSDDVLALFGPPLAPADAAKRVRPLVTAFPAGLLTPAGLLVANPALSGSPDLWGRFARRHYHGTVIWAWPEAMAELGIARQLATMPAGSERAELERARDTLRALRRRLESRGLGELWGFRAQDGEIVPASFGASASDTTESNSLQLWSASWLALALTDRP